MKKSIPCAAVAVGALMALPPVAPASPSGPPVIAPDAAIGRTELVGGNPLTRLEYQAWIDAAAPIVKQAAVKVFFKEANCPRTRTVTSCVVQGGPGTRLRLYIPKALRNPRTYVAADLKNTVLHEIGHVYDFSIVTDGHRKAFSDVFGWKGRYFGHGPRPSFEQFAVAYSYCAEGLTYEQAVARFDLDVYKLRFTREQFATACWILRSPVQVAPLRHVRKSR